MSMNLPALPANRRPSMWHAGCLLLLWLPTAWGQPSSSGLVLNEILYFQDPANPDVIRAHEWVEVYNPGPIPVNLMGWLISNRNGRPGPGARALPSIIMPVGSYLLVHFASGTKDYSFTNNFSQHYTGDPPNVNLFDDKSDGVALYSPSQLVDFAAWDRGAGLTGVAFNEAVATGQWPAGRSINTAKLINGRGEKVRNFRPGTSIGRDANSTDNNRPEDWDANGGRDAVDITLGRRNLDALNLVSMPKPKPPVRDWTVLVYMSADNSLEKYSYPNLKQMEAAGGSDDNVNIVAMVDGQKLLQQATVDAANKLVPVPGTLGKTWRFQIGSGPYDPRFVTMVNNPGDDPFLGERNMGDPRELSGFIAWAQANYPAKKYALILWDHGLGWKGFGNDDSSHGTFASKDALYMGELSTALAGTSFELIGFDACLMGMIEVAYQLQPFSNYFVASEELISAAGWPYDKWLAKLKANPGWNGSQLGTQIVSDYTAFYSAPDPTNPGQVLDPDHTLSAVDQSQIPNLVNVVSAFAIDLKNGADDFRTHDTFDDNVEHRIALDSASTERYDTTLPPQSVDWNYMDLHHFSDLINMDRGIPPCYKGQLPNLLARSKRLGPVVIAEAHGPNHPNSNGLSIYMPLERTGDNLPPMNDDPYDAPDLSRVTDGSSPRAMYAPNNDLLPLEGIDQETGLPLRTPAEWPYLPTPNFRFPADTQWDEFLMRFYHPVADNRIRYAIGPDGQIVCPDHTLLSGDSDICTKVPPPACGNPVDEITVLPGSTVFFSGRGSSDADTANRLPLHWMWDFDHLTKGCGACIAPYELTPGVHADMADDGVDDDHDGTKDELTDEKEADAPLTSHSFCQQLRDYKVTLHAWDDNHLFPFHDTNSKARYVHIQTDDHISIVHCTPFEIDQFATSTATVEIRTPLGSEKVALVGPTTIAVDLSRIGDLNGHGLDAVNTEMTQLELTGTSSLFGPVKLRLRSPAKPPFKKTTGQIEETVNTQSGRLDLPPFAPSGSAQSYFDVFFEMEAPGAPPGFQLLHNVAATRMVATITHKPPAVGENYFNRDSVPLYDEAERMTAVVVANALHTPQPRSILLGGVVNSASFVSSSIAPGSIATVFGQGFTSAGTTMLVTDSAGNRKVAPLLFVSPRQINFVVPADLQPGSTNLAIVSGDGSLSVGTAEIGTVGPGVFSANANGKGVAAALVVRVAPDGSQKFEPVFACDPETRSCVSRPIDAGPETDQLFLILFGTGIRLRSALSAVDVKIGETDASVSYAGAQNEFAGLDQINVRLPPLGLIGHGEIPIVLTVDGKQANTVTINIR